MATLLGDARVRIRPDLDGFEREAESGIGRITNRIGALIRRGLMVGGAAVGVAGGIGLKVAADLEQAEIGFTTMLGSAEKADKFLKDLSNFAAKTPFEFPELQSAASRLIAVGTEADRVIPIMAVLGDATAAMGTGAEGVNRATMALQQMQVKGKVTGEEMLQLAEAGVPAWEALAAQLGVTTGEAQKMVSEGKVSVEDLFTAIESRQGESFARMNGMMEKQSATLSGLWSTLKDTVQMRLAQAVEPFIPLIKDAMDRAAPILDRMFTAIADFGEDAAPVLRDVGSAVAAAFKWLADNKDTVLAALTGVATTFTIIKTAGAAKAVWLFAGAMKAAMLAMGPLGWISLALGALVGGLVLAYRKSETFRDIVGGAIDTVKQAFENLKAVFEPVWEAFSSAFSEAEGPGGIGGFFTRLGEGIEAAWPVLQDALRTLGTALWEWIKEAGPPALRAIGDFLADVGDWIINDGLPLLWQTLQDLGQALIDWIGPRIGPALLALGSFLGAVVTWIADEGIPWLWDTLVSLGSKLVEWIAPRIPGLLGELAGFLGYAVGWVIGTGIPMLIGALLKMSWELISWIAPRIPGLLRELGSFLGSALTWIVTEGIPLLVESLLEMGKKGLQGLIDGLMDSPLADVGRDLLDNLGEGLTDFGNKVKEWASSIKDKIVGEIKDLFGIHSPSRVMAELGGHMVSGLLQGLFRGQSAIRGAVNTVFGKPLDFIKSLSFDDILALNKQIPGFLMAAMRYHPAAFAGRAIGDALGAVSGGAAGLRPHVATAKGVIHQLFGIKDIGGFSVRNIFGTGKLSDHAKGLALDAMTWDKALGDAVVDFFMANAEAFNVNYAIWKQRIKYPGGDWRKMADRGSPTQNHMDHVHLSFFDKGGLAKNLGFMPKATLAPERVLSPRQTKAFEDWMRGDHSAQGALVENLTIESTGDVRDDLGEALFQLHRIKRGGVHHARR